MGEPFLPKQLGDSFESRGIETAILERLDPGPPPEQCFSERGNSVVGVERPHHGGGSTTGHVDDQAVRARIQRYFDGSHLLIVRPLRQRGNPGSTKRDQAAPSHSATLRSGP